MTACFHGGCKNRSASSLQREGEDKMSEPWRHPGLQRVPHLPEGVCTLAPILVPESERKAALR
jgi:hypothetical protein